MAETHPNAFATEIAEKRAQANALNAQADELQAALNARLGIVPDGVVEEIDEPEQAVEDPETPTAEEEPEATSDEEVSTDETLAATEDEPEEVEEVKE